jgi:hypothetical protein
MGTVPLDRRPDVRIRALATAAFPAFTVIGDGTMPGKRPNVMEGKDARFVSCQRRKRQVAESVAKAVKTKDVGLQVGSVFWNPERTGTVNAI